MGCWCINNLSWGRPRGRDINTEKAELEGMMGPLCSLSRKVTGFLSCCPRVRGVTEELEGTAAMSSSRSFRCSQVTQPQSQPEVQVGAGLKPKGSYTRSNDALFFLVISSQCLTLSHKGTARQSLADKARQSATRVLEFGSGSASNYPRDLGKFAQATQICSLTCEMGLVAVTSQSCWRDLMR